MKGKLFTIASILMVISMLLAACAQSPAAVATEAPKVIKIGLVAPYTGPNSRVGDELKGIHETAFGKKSTEKQGEIP